MDRSPSSHPPGVVALPASVEEMIQRICRDQGVSPLDAYARQVLADLGEAISLEILRSVAGSKVRKSFAGYVIHLSKNVLPGTSRVAPAGSVREGAPLAGSSGPAPRQGGSQMLHGPYGEATRSSPSSPQLTALGELDFRKSFLILSYIGNKKLEDMVSADVIRGIKHLPMSTFEDEIWKSVGQRCINKSERRCNHDWESDKTNLYHCHVDLDGRVIFKGPYLQQQRTHLQRVLGDENVLVVKFAEKESKEDGLQRNILHCSSLYRKFAQEGIPVGLRRYHFFVFKDGGKVDRRKNPTSSAVKCYFVRTESHCAIDRDEPYILHEKPIDVARRIFMHVHTVETMSKYMPRFSLILSKTVKMEIDLSSVNVMFIGDIPCKDENGNVVTEWGKEMIHTDGTGYISEDLARKCPRNIFKGHYSIPRDVQAIIDALKMEDLPLHLGQFYSLVCPMPLLMQVRLFHNGYAIKGTLLVNKKLPPQTIHVRPSMVKVERDRDFSTIHSANSLEVVKTSNPPKRTTTLSRHLIALLHYGGVPREFFLALLSNAVIEAERARLDRRAALKVALRHADMDDYLVVRMILSGMPMDEPLLQFRLSVLMREERKGLKEGKLPLNDCYYLMGTTDPIGRLKPNEVCIILDKGQVSGDVLVYRNPGLHFGDIHVLTATYVKDLEDVIGNARYAIFFPTQGPRSVAYEIANSDFDGDMYWVSMNKELLRHFRPSAPWTAPLFNKTKCHQERPTAYSSQELENELFHLFLETRFTPSYSMSVSSHSWLSFMDRLLTLGHDCEDEKQILREKMLELVDIYYNALDAPKQGLKVEVPYRLKAEKYPHFLEKKSSYRSTSVLGEIFDKVNCTQTDPRKEIWKLSCFEGEVPRSMELWQGRYRKYREEMTMALEVESKEIKGAAAKEVTQKYKRMLYGASDFVDCTRVEDDVFDEALSIYHVSYDYAMQKDEVGRCSFAWNVAGQALCALFAKKCGKGSILCSTDVLHEVLG